MWAGKLRSSEKFRAHDRPEERAAEAAAGGDANLGSVLSGDHAAAAGVRTVAASGELSRVGVRGEHCGISSRAASGLASREANGGAWSGWSGSGCRWMSRPTSSKRKECSSER